VRTILDFGFTKSISLAEVRPYHDYALDVQTRYPDAIFGNWLQIDPRTGVEGADEFRRCAAASKGFIGICVSAPGMGFPASDPIYDPFYEASIELGPARAGAGGHDGQRRRIAGRRRRAARPVAPALCRRAYPCAFRS
jgi:predicted TIM-barrel fold metal-dependent hydrolase